MSAHDPAEVELVAEALANRPYITYGVHMDVLRGIASDVLTALAPAFAEARAEGWDEGYMRGRHPWTSSDEEVDPIPSGVGPARFGRNANPYRDLAATHGEAVESDE